LQFTEDTIDGHEFGHAHEGLGGGDVNSSGGKSKAIRMENTVRARHQDLLGKRRRERE
jgi:hypothetical protein